MHSIRTPKLLLGLLAAHLAWVIARVPHSVAIKRMREVDEFVSRGDARHFLDNEHLHGAAAIEWIRDRAGPQEVVLWDGDHRGAFEFAPLLLFPRVLIRADHLGPEEDEFEGRRIALGTIDGRHGQIVLVGKGDDLELAIR
ncbi:MAG: hypothetical protein U1F36_21435 [Planctomycetota bacterium]